jgi:hypothetical protein
MSILSETNPYLKDKKIAARLNSRSTRTSCGVEGIVANHTIKINITPDHSKTDAIFREIQSRLRKN